MPKKKLQSSKSRQTRKASPGKKQSAPRKVSPQKKYAQAIKRIIKQTKQTPGFKKKSETELRKTAQRVYRETGKKAPNKNDIAGALKIVKRSKSKAKIKVAGERLTASQIIEQAIDELAKGAGFRAAITEKMFDRKNMLVKITIRGKDYTKHITGRIAERSGSTILRWTWETKRTKG